MKEEELLPQDFCGTCKYRGFSPAKGIFCKLTGEKGVFFGSCVQYDKDEKVYEDWMSKKRKNAHREAIENTGGLSTIGIESGIYAGLVYMLSMAILELVLVIYFRKFSVIPVVLFFAGCVLLVKGILNRPIRNKHNDVIDNL
jgi:hypothetical protein